jgi:hypothetical protein
MSVEWRYLAGRPVAHALTQGCGARSVARCGVTPPRWARRGWFGADHADEVERAAGLPKCGRCVRHLAADKESVS